MDSITVDSNYRLCFVPVSLIAMELFARGWLNVDCQKTRQPIKSGCNYSHDLDAE